jgi:hypothetical protein
MQSHLIIDLRWRRLTALLRREDGQVLPCVQNFPGGESTRYLSCDMLAGTVGKESFICLGESIESCDALHRLPNPLQRLSSPAGGIPPDVDLAALALPLFKLSVAPIFEFLATQDVKSGQLGVWLLVPASFSRDAAAVVSRALSGYGVRRVRYVLRHLAAAAFLLATGQWPEVVVVDVEDDDLLVHRVTLKGSTSAKVLTSAATRTVFGFGWSFWVSEMTAFLTESGRLPMVSEVRYAVDRGLLGAFGAPYSSLVNRNPPVRLGHAEVDEMAREMADGRSLQALKTSLEGVFHMLSIAAHVPWMGLGAPFAFNGLESIFQGAVGSDRPQLLKEVPALDRTLHAARGMAHWLAEDERRRVTLASNASVRLATTRRQSLELVTANADRTTPVLETRRTVHQALKLEGQIDPANALPVRLLWGTNPDPHHCAPLGSLDLKVDGAPARGGTVFLDLDLRRTPTSMAPRGSVGVRLGDNAASTRLRPPPLATQLTHQDVLAGSRARAVIPFLEPGG